MLGGLGNLAGLLKNAREMQSKMAEVQDELASRRITAESGAGAVRATVDGHGMLVDLKIDPASTDDVELLEDLVKAAVGAAVKKSRDQMKEEFAKLTGGFNMPGLSQMLEGG
ncbi:MAG: YbaB/EbfC family nucleoid-associated protein [Phycisphaerae bacterium]|nr:YbaB/EbfC family nucleoid-associated protein [Phycisphaerae bacterium]